MDSLSVLFDGATAFGFLALCSIHLHLYFSLRPIKQRLNALETVPCHAVALQKGSIK
jgi:hypothetical protein